MNFNFFFGFPTGTTGRWKVSAKIQQLLNTLKRPKRRPLPEFYEDNDIELEIAGKITCTEFLMHLQKRKKMAQNTKSTAINSNE